MFSTLDLFLNSYLLTFLFTNESGANCNPIYVLSIVITVISTKMHQHTFQMLFFFFFTGSLVYRKLIVERTAQIEIEGLEFVLQTDGCMQYIINDVC
jgi:hypothetical protein